MTAAFRQAHYHVLAEKHMQQMLTKAMPFDLTRFTIQFSTPAAAHHGNVAARVASVEGVAKVDAVASSTAANVCCSGRDVTYEDGLGGRSGAVCAMGCVNAAAPWHILLL
jgi:hypothetical protein